MARLPLAPAVLESGDGAAAFLAKAAAGAVMRRTGAAASARRKLIASRGLLGSDQRVAARQALAAAAPLLSLLLTMLTTRGRLIAAASSTTRRPTAQPMQRAGQGSIGWASFVGNGSTVMLLANESAVEPSGCPSKGLGALSRPHAVTCISGSVASCSRRECGPFMLTCKLMATETHRAGPADQQHKSGSYVFVISTALTLGDTSSSSSTASTSTSISRRPPPRQQQQQRTHPTTPAIIPCCWLHDPLSVHDPVSVSSLLAVLSH